MQLTCIFSVENFKLVFHEKSFRKVIANCSKIVDEVSLVTVLGQQNTGKTTLVNYIMFDFIQNHSALFNDRSKNGVWMSSEPISLVNYPSDSKRKIGIVIVDVAGQIYTRQNEEIYSSFIDFMLTISSVGLINFFQQDLTKQLISEFEGSIHRDKIRILLHDYDERNTPKEGYRFSDGLHVNVFEIPSVKGNVVDDTLKSGNYHRRVQDVYFHSMKLFNIRRCTFSVKKLKKNVLLFASPLERYPVERSTLCSVTFK